MDQAQAPQQGQVNAAQQAATAAEARRPVTTFDLENKSKDIKSKDNGVVKVIRDNYKEYCVDFNDANEKSHKAYQLITGVPQLNKTSGDETSLVYKFIIPKDVYRLSEIKKSQILTRSLASVFDTVIKELSEILGINSIYNMNLEDIFVNVKTGKIEHISSYKMIPLQGNLVPFFVLYKEFQSIFPLQYIEKTYSQVFFNFEYLYKKYSK